ncbi:MAG TPA: hypothetical protein VNF03_15590, partial [Patescibacteria group bacterium]|nr:hypothetical protein [Patescibacteria group bacterium]
PSSGPSIADGPWAPLAAIAQAALTATAAASHAPTASAPALHGSPQPPVAPEPGTSGAPAGAGAGSGVAFSVLLALLFSFAAFALQHYSRLRLPPAQWRRLAYVAVLERPG